MGQIKRIRIIHTKRGNLCIKGRFFCKHNDNNGVCAKCSVNAGSSGKKVLYEKGKYVTD